MTTLQVNGVAGGQTPPTPRQQQGAQPMTPSYMTGTIGPFTPFAATGPTFQLYHSVRQRPKRAPLPPKTMPSELHFDLAQVYLQDALKIRPPQIRIQEKPGALFTPLMAYKLMKSWIWSHLVYMVIWAHMLMAVWEPPGYDRVPQWVLILEFLFLVIFMIDICLKYYSHDKREIGNWTQIIILVIMIDVLLTIILFIFNEVGFHDSTFLSIFNCWRVGRPFYLFYKSRDLKKLTRSIVKGLPSLCEVALLISLFLLLFGFFGFTLFYESNVVGQNDHFETFGEAVYSLLVLQTTSNFPDIMMQSYYYSEYVAIYFFIYNVLGIYFLMALVLAVVYNNYNQHIVVTVKKIKRTKEEAIDQAFKVLVYHQNHAIQEFNDKRFATARETLENKFQSSMRNVFGAGTSNSNNSIQSNDSDDEIGIELRRAATQAMEQEQERRSKQNSRNNSSANLVSDNSKRPKNGKNGMKGKNNLSSNTRNEEKNKKNDEKEENQTGTATATAAAVATKKKMKYREVIYFNTFHELIRRMRPDLRKQFKDSEEESGQIKNMYLAMANAPNRDYDDGINIKQFRDIDQFIEMEINKDVAQSKRYSVLMKSQFIESRLVSLGKTMRQSDGNSRSKQENSKNNENKNKKDKRATAGLTNMSELLTMDMGELNDKKSATTAAATSGKNGATNGNGDVNATKVKFIHSFQRSLDDADLSFCEFIKYICDCRLWSRICIIETSKKYWYKLRLALISFWQWKTEIVICKDDLARRLSARRRNFDATLHGRDNTVRRGNIVGFTPRFSDAKLDSFGTMSFDGPDDRLLCSKIKISTDTFINLLVFLSTILVIVDVYKPGEYEWLALIVVWLFLFEVILKMIAFGIDGYLSDSFNKLDFFISFTAFLFEVILQDSIKIVVIFRIVRMLRLLRAFTRFRVILRTTKAVLSSFTALFVLEFCLAYMYAIIGCELFSGLISKEIVEDLCNDTSDGSELTSEFWCVIYDSYYYENNFNTFSHAMVVLMELIVVNNWHMITLMYTSVTNNFARIYFVFVYFTAVVIVMNVLTAFVLEAFISQYQKSDSMGNMDVDEEDEDETLEARMHEAMRAQGTREEEIKLWHYSRKLTKGFFYQRLYPELFRDNNNSNVENYIASYGYDYYDKTPVVMDGTNNMNNGNNHNSGHGNNNDNNDDAAAVGDIDSGAASNDYRQKHAKFYNQAYNDYDDDQFDEDGNIIPNGNYFNTKHALYESMRVDKASRPQSTLVHSHVAHYHRLSSARENRQKSGDNTIQSRNSIENRINRQISLENKLIVTKHARNHYFLKQTIGTDSEAANDYKEDSSSDHNNNHDNHHNVANESLKHNEDEHDDDDEKRHALSVINDNDNDDSDFGSKEKETENANETENETENENDDKLDTKRSVRFGTQDQPRQAVRVDSNGKRQVIPALQVFREKHANDTDIEFSSKWNTLNSRPMTGRSDVSDMTEMSEIGFRKPKIDLQDVNEYSATGPHGHYPANSDLDVEYFVYQGIEPRYMQIKGNINDSIVQHNARGITPLHRNNHSNNGINNQLQLELQQQHQQQQQQANFALSPLSDGNGEPSSNRSSSNVETPAPNSIRLFNGTNETNNEIVQDGQTHKLENMNSQGSRNSHSDTNLAMFNTNHSNVSQMSMSGDHNSGRNNSNNNNDNDNNNNNNNNNNRNESKLQNDEKSNDGNIQLTPLDSITAHGGYPDRTNLMTPSVASVSAVSQIDHSYMVGQPMSYANPTILGNRSKFTYTNNYNNNYGGKYGGYSSNQNSGINSNYTSDKQSSSKAGLASENHSKLSQMKQRKSQQKLQSIFTDDDDDVVED